ncbi:Panacea domain-containing protein [Bacteroides sp. 519]|uniref:Panacea domain-containing protein n=1 Tax=Bacteroides sp. 519 TaxID=2302937 RepID=UPI0013D08978|nr:Panacea domain-containing protein [Bacteroides sp. 519]NDV59091.1 DUF4065 domain-containing protein [Bacteroides sp. 519]
MKTNDQILKIRATLLYILQAFSNGADYIKIFKILYFAQQKHLVAYGHEIVEDSFMAREHGPVPAFLYKCLKSLEVGDEKGKDIVAFIQNITCKEYKGHSVFYTKEKPDMDELSISNLKCLDESIEENKDKDSFLLSEESHKFAYNEAVKRFKQYPDIGDRLSIIDIAKEGGATQEIINYIKENLFIDQALYKLCQD